MSVLKELFLKAARAVKFEYTRLDRVCNACGREIFGGDSWEFEYFCDDCARHLPYNNRNICAHCGRSAVNPTARCVDCEDIDTGYDMARSPFYYAPPVDEMIRRMKYRDKRYLSAVFAKFLAVEYLKYFSDADVAAFVPMKRRAKRKRGFNQSEYLARWLSRETGITVVDVLEKTVKTERQVRLGRVERIKNLKGSFNVRNRGLIEGKTVVLVDDVTTTGATAVTISHLLLDAGATKVYVLTVASVTNSGVARALGQEQSSARIRRRRRR